MIKSALSLQLDRARRLTRALEMVKRYADGESVQSIADIYECHRGTILRNARAAGLPKRVKGFAKGIREATISLYKEKIPIAEIARRLDVSQAYVSKTAVEEGINRRKFKKRESK